MPFAFPGQSIVSGHGRRIVAGAVAAAGPVTVFTDNFDRADENLEVSANWTNITAIAAGLRVVSNQLSTFSTDAVGSAYQSPDLGSQNQYIQYVGTGSGSAGPFACCRMQDANNWIGVRSSTTAYQVWKRVAGTLTQIGTITGTPTIGDVVRIEVSGGNVRGLINGVEGMASTSLGGDTVASTRHGLVARSQLRQPWIDSYEAGVLP